MSCTTTQRENRIGRAVMHVTCVSMRLTTRRVALSVIIYCNVIIFAFLSLGEVSVLTKNFCTTYHYRIKLESWRIFYHEIESNKILKFLNKLLKFVSVRISHCKCYLINLIFVTFFWLKFFRYFFFYFSRLVFFFTYFLKLRNS